MHAIAANGKVSFRLSVSYLKSRRFIKYDQVVIQYTDMGKDNSQCAPTFISSWLRQRLLWSLIEIILLLCIGPFVSIVQFVFILCTYHNIGKAPRLRQSIIYVGIRMALVGTEVFVLRYGFLVIANMLRKTGIFLEHLCNEIPLEHIGIYYLPFAMILAFHFSQIFFRCIVAASVHFPFLSLRKLFREVIVQDAYLMLDRDEASLSPPVKQLFHRKRET